jgi:hypothetical protein
MIGISILLIAFGLALIGMGVGGRLGYFKTLYLIKGIPGLYPSGYIYAFIPIGIGSCLLALALLLPDQELGGDIVGFGSWGIILLSITLMIWKPWWLKPWWLKWLEDHYGPILEDMLDEARRTWNMGNQPHTEADLETWADSIARRHR